MKILGVIGSPRREGNSAALLSRVLSAAVEHSAQAETVFLHSLHLSPCQGCYHCETTGRCEIRDGMVELSEKIRACDALVLASPVYFHHVAAQMKLFLDRLYAFIDVKNGRQSRLSRRGRGAVILTHENGDRDRYAAVTLDLVAILSRFRFDVIGTVVGYGLGRESTRGIPQEMMDRAREIGVRLATEPER